MSTKEIWIEDHELYYHGQYNIETFNIDALNYAYVQVLGNVPYLFVSEDRQHYISTMLKGFDEIYRQLSDRFHFDDHLFFTVCKNKNEDEKVKIWAKKMSQNYQILKEYQTDGDLGYEVYSESKKMISWDTTYKELEALDCVESYFTDYETSYLRFKYPVRVEGVLINQLKVYLNNANPNLPVQEYFVSLYDETNTDKSYKDLRNLWLDEDIDVDDYGYEREDQCSLEFVFAEGISASIYYTYDVGYGYDDGSTRLNFYNNREYPHFLENKEYEDVMEITGLISIGKKLDINVRYKNNKFVKNIPLKVKAKLSGKSGIWTDQLNQKIGFSGIDTAFIIDISDIDRFVFQNVLPARGPGYANFMVYFNSGSCCYLFSEDTYFFDQFAKQLEQMTNKLVEIPKEYNNC